MTLIAAGQNTRNRAMLGLQAMSQEEAERERGVLHSGCAEG